MPPSRFSSSLFAHDDAFAVLYATPKVARPFPRRKVVLYALICLLWLGFGVFGRDPWKPEETLLVAHIAALINPPSSSAAGAAVALGFGFESHPPLYIWLASLMAWATAGWLPLHEGARLANVLLVTAGFAFVYGAVALRYGARTAWLALLLLVGCVGFVVRAHVLNFGVPAFFGAALALLGAVLLADERRRVSQVFVSGGCIGGAAAFLLLACGAVAAVGGLLALCVARRGQSAVFAVAAAFFAPALVYALIGDFSLLHGVGGRFVSLGAFAATVADAVRVAAWSLLPLLPVALYGLWFSRRARVDRLEWFAWLAVLWGVVAFLLTGQNEEDYYLLLPPLALLAAQLLLKTPDGTASVMDFFALLVIGLCIVGGLWLVWAALVWEVPSLLAVLGEWLPGFALPPVRWVAVVVAAVLTVGWVALLLNFGRHNERAVVNWSCGITLVWALFNLLLVGYVDSGKSFRSPAAALAAAVGDECVSAPSERHWRAQLFYFGVPLGDLSCPFVLRRGEGGDGAKTRVARGGGGQGYYLYRRF